MHFSISASCELLNVHEVGLDLVEVHGNVTKGVCGGVGGEEKKFCTPICVGA